MAEYKLLNGTALAYVGDAYYDLYIRKYLVDKSLTKVDELHKTATGYVSAVSQAKVIEELLDSHFLSIEETDIVRRGRNAKTNHKRPNVDILTYKHSTSFESLIGYLYLSGDDKRLREIIAKAITLIESW